MDQAHKLRQAIRRWLPLIARPAWLLAACLFALWPLSGAWAEIRNDAIATATYGAQTLLSAPASQSVPLAPAAPSLAVAIAPDSNGFAKPGDTVAFTITVTNTGDVTLDELAVGDAGAASVTCRAGKPALAPGQSQSCRAIHVATKADIAAGRVQATVDVAATAPDGLPVEAQPATASIPLLTMDIALNLTRVSGPDEPKENATVTTHVETSNAGPIEASGVIVAIRLPAGLGLVSDTGGGAYDAASGTWTIGTLAAGTTATLDIAARVENSTAGQTLTTRAELMAADQVDANATNDSAAFAVTVARTVVVAADDKLGDVTARIEATAGAVVPGIANVLANDTVDGGAAGLDTVTVSAQPGPVGPLTINADGSVDIQTGIAAGTYQHGYRICLISNPANCAEATVSATVSPVPLTAADDIVERRANGRDGETGLVNVLENDLRGERAVTPSNVQNRMLEAVPPQSLNLNADGTVDLAPGSPAGTATLDYEVCEILNPDNCGRARVSVPVEVPAVVSGAVYRDANGNGVFDAGRDPAFEDYTVDLLRGGALVASVRTGPSGQYALPTVWPGPDHALVFRDPDGKIIGGLPNIDVTGGAVMTGENLATDPTGIIYDATSREPLAGAVTAIVDADGKPLPAACFMAPGQQGQTSAADGAYRFDLAPGADPACPTAQSEYAIAITPPAGYLVPSSAYPPLAGPLDMTACVFDAVPGGACQPSASETPPPAGTPGVHVLSILLQAGDPPLLHNHIPLDPQAASAPPAVTVTADKADLRPGETVTLAIEIRNLDPLPLGPVRVTNVMPVGFAYVDGSATVDGETVQPTVSPSALDFGPLTLAGNATVMIRVTVRANAAATPGSHVNRVRATDMADKPLAADTLSAIEITGKPDTDCMEAAGTVFADANGNGKRDGGEAGLGGVVIVTGAGTPVVTDRQGRYLVACGQLPNGDAGPSLVLKLDEQSLPPGFKPTTENPRSIARTTGTVGAMDFGAAKPREVRLDLQDAAFAGDTADLKPEWTAGIQRLVTVLAEQPSTLRIVYKTGAEAALARHRVETVEQAVRARWSQLGHADEITITSKIAGK